MGKKQNTKKHRKSQHSSRKKSAPKIYQPGNRNTIPGLNNITFTMIKIAASQGDARAQHALGSLFYMGNVLPQDYEQARIWFEKAAAQGYADAQWLLGSMYYKGEGIPQDLAKAHELLEKAAAQGAAEAQYLLGCMYYKGEHVQQDFEKARELFEQAAAQGQPFAKSALQQRYSHSREN